MGIGQNDQMREDTDPQGSRRQGQKDKDLPTEVLGLVGVQSCQGRGFHGVIQSGREVWKQKGLVGLEGKMQVMGLKSDTKSPEREIKT